jgi:hypothetical protein
MWSIPVPAGKSLFQSVYCFLPGCSINISILPAVFISCNFNHFCCFANHFLFANECRKKITCTMGNVTSYKSICDEDSISFAAVQKKLSYSCKALSGGTTNNYYFTLKINKCTTRKTWLNLSKWMRLLPSNGRSGGMCKC